MIMTSPAEFRQQVEAVIEKEIRPSLQQHGGDLRIKEIRKGKVWVALTGACHNCPSAWITLEHLITKKLKDKLQNKLEGVYIFNDTDEEMLDFAKKILNKQNV